MNDIIYVGEHSKTYDVRWHTHDHWELVYCTGGRGAFRFQNGSTISYQAGNMVAIPPRELHVNSSAEGFTNIHLTMTDPTFSYRTSFRIVDSTDGGLRTAFMQARVFTMSDRKKRELVLASLGNLIASYIVVARSNTEFSEPVERIRASIISNYANCDFALDDTIREQPFNYDYLRKLFKKEMGVSPLEYLVNMRMRSAEMLLSSMWANEYTISDVAQMCGFADALYFSRVFKKYYGMSPMHYAKAKSTVNHSDPGRTEMPDPLPPEIP